MDTSTNFWVQEAPLGTVRQAVIHLGDCPLCEEGQKNNGQDRWYGPLASLSSARDISDQLTDIALRAECRCVRRVVSQDLSALALLNEPLFQRPSPVADRKTKKEQKAEKVAKAAAAKAKARKSKPSKLPRYVVLGVSAAAILLVSLFVFPALSVVQAGSHGGSSPFLITNSSPLPLTNLNAECSVELQAASVSLQNSHLQLANRLGAKNEVTIPCFQSTGGAIPQTSGVTVRVTVNYAVFGIHHVQQTFSFVAARTSEGYCRWVLKG